MRKTAFCGLMLALALIASYVESLIPVPIPVPGIKLGVTNSIILILVYCTGIWLYGFSICSGLYANSGKKHDYAKQPLGIYRCDDRS